MVQRVIVMAVLMIGLFVIGANPAMAQSRIFNFFIQNIDSAPVTVRLDASWEGVCYEGSAPSGEIWENVPPQGKVTIVLARTQGHGCDGKNGTFALHFTPKIGVKEMVLFNFDNAGSLWIVQIANQYPGNLGPKGGPSDQSYTYTTFARPKVTAGKPQGSWEQFCSGICDRMIKNEITNQTTKESTVTEETKTAISVALEAGLEFEGVGSAKTTVTASLEKTVGKSMSNGVMNSSTTGDEQKVAISLEQSETFNIHSVWRWVAKTTLSNGQSYIVKTNKYTCTPDEVEPTYLPGSKEDIRTCRGKNAVTAEKPQDTAPKPAPVEAPKPVSNPPQAQGGIAKITRQQLEDEFRTCAEAMQHGAATDEDFTRSLYWRYLGHATDGNVQAHAARITNGQITRQQLDAEFRTCAEAQQHGVSTTTDFTISLYWRYLGHGQDGNLQNHANRLVG